MDDFGFDGQGNLDVQDGSSVKDKDGKNDDAAIAACGGSMEIVLTRLQPGEEIK